MAAPSASVAAVPSAWVAPPRPTHWNCEPRIDPQLGAAALREAERLIRAHGDHVSVGELRVILPLLRLAAHSGNTAAQRRYGYYVVGYWATDEMFWPRDKPTAVDALALLHHAYRLDPQSFGPEGSPLAKDGRLGDDPNGLALPKEWVAAARKAESEFDRCERGLAPD